MIEVIKRHLAERNMLKTAGLSLCYLAKKGEEKCVRAAEAIIQNEVMDVIPFLGGTGMFVHDGRSGNDYLSWNPEKRGM